MTDDDERPVLVPPDPGEPTLGWELQLVAELADRWGVRHETFTTLGSRVLLTGVPGHGPTCTASRSPPARSASWLDSVE